MKARSGGAAPGAHDVPRIACIALQLAVAKVCLRCVDLRRCLAWFDRRGGVMHIDDAQVSRLARLVGGTARRVPWSVTCLERSLVLHAILMRGGVVSALRIGVSVHDRTLDAHAWVEVDGMPVNDVPDVSRRYASLPLPTRGP